MAAALANLNPISPALSNAALKVWNLEEEGTAIAIFVAVLIFVVALVNLVMNVEHPRPEASSESLACQSESAAFFDELSKAADVVEYCRLILYCKGQ